MNAVRLFLKKVRLRQILTIFLAGLLLIVSTACSGANSVAANPQNPAVQAGGDKYSNYRMSPDPKIANLKASQGREQASLQPSSQLLIATNRESEILYPSGETPAGRIEKEVELPLITDKDFREPEPGGLIQNEPNVGDRVKDRLETVKETFEEASGFLKNKADEGASRPELQKNPAVGR